jgi:hypothetical protein
MTAAPDQLLLPRGLALALYGAAQADPERVVRGFVLQSRRGLVFLRETERSEDPVFAAVRSQPEGTPPPDHAELERLLGSAPLVLVVSRATRGVMVLSGHRRGRGGAEPVEVRLED